MVLTATQHETGGAESVAAPNAEAPGVAVQNGTRLAVGSVSGAPAIADPQSAGVLSLARAAPPRPTAVC
jgi:hypothetical protein